MRGLLAVLLMLWGFGPAMAAEPLALVIEGTRLSSDDYTGRPVIEVRLGTEARRLFGEFTAAHVGRRIDVLVGEDVVTSPVIRTPIYGSAVMISGLDTMAEAEAIVMRLSGKKAVIFVRPSLE